MTRMEKSTAKPGKQPVQKPPQEPAQEPAKIGSVEVEAFAHNIARLVEEGGKALAAYMKPREEGKIKNETGRQTSPTWSRPSARWRNIGCPTRSARSNCRPASAAPISICGPARSSAWPANRPSRSSRPTPRTNASPIRNGRRTSSSISSSRSICSPRNGASGWCATPKVDEQTRQKAAFYVKQIANAISPSNFVLTNPELLRETLASKARKSGARHAHAGRGHQGRPRQSQDPPVEPRRSSRSAAISRSPPARWCSRTN